MTKNAVPPNAVPSHAIPNRNGTPGSYQSNTGPTKTDSRQTAVHRSRRAHYITIAFAVPILVFSGLGFAAKFLEFIHTFQGETEGAFAITPMVNYLLASAGFFCMLVWATINGMFHDIERPKQTMLDNDIALDRSE